MARLAIILSIVGALIIVVFQNREPVETHLLFTRFEMPRAALIFVTFSVGALTGALATWGAVSRGKKS